MGTTPWGGGTTTVTYASDVVNQYTTVGGTSRTHDDNGNLTDDGTYTYHYDFQNRLTEVKNSGSGTSVATYKFDALGRRVEKAVSGGSTTRYILDGQQVVEEYDGSNAWQAHYVYEDGIDNPRSMDRADIADVNGNANTTEILRFHYHQSALGSVSEMTQPTGAVVEWVTYDIYGKATVRDQNGVIGTASYVGSPWLYTGREWDPESAKYHYRARGYDPATGRFMQRDPVGYEDGLSLYESVMSSPATLVDPMGTLSIHPMPPIGTDAWWEWYAWGLYQEWMRQLKERGGMVVPCKRDKFDWWGWLVYILEWDLTASPFTNQFGGEDRGGALRGSKPWHPIPPGADPGPGRHPQTGGATPIESPDAHQAELTRLRQRLASVEETIQGLVGSISAVFLRIGGVDIGEIGVSKNPGKLAKKFLKKLMKDLHKQPEWKQKLLIRASNQADQLERAVSERDELERRIAEAEREER